MLVPELDVKELEASLLFYVQILGFNIRFQRPEEQFAYLERPGAELMLQRANGPGRRFRTAPLEKPFGRGVNLQIDVGDDLDVILARLSSAGTELLVPVEERWYRTPIGSEGNRQFVVADPDGYLLRPFQDLGVRTGA